MTIPPLVHQPPQRSVHGVVRQNILMPNAQHEKQNAINVIRIKGHYSSLCHTKRTTISSLLSAEITYDPEDNDNYLGTVDSQQEAVWLSVLKVHK